MAHTLCKPDAITVSLGLGGLLRDLILADNPVGYWPLFELQGTTNYDHSGNGYDGTHQGSPVLGQPSALPEGGTGIALDKASSERVSMGDQAALRPTTAVTFEMLVYFTLGSVVQHIGGFYRASVSQGYGLWLTATNTLRFSVWDDTPLEQEAESDVVSLSTWYHVVCTWAQGGKAILYVNGTKYESAGTLSNPMTFGSVEGFHLGSWDERLTSPERYFTGALFQVAVHSTNFSDAQVAARYAATQWTDVSADVVDGTLAWSLGISGNEPKDRLASSGSLTFELKNSLRNSAATVGYYSPNHASVRSGFGFDSFVKVDVTPCGGGDPVTMFWGRLYIIDPQPGLYGNRRTLCTAYDYVYMLSEYDVRAIDPQINQNEDVLIKTVIDALPNSATRPMSVSIDAGVDSYPYAFHDLQDGESAIGILQKIVISSWGRIFVDGNGTLRYISRTSILTATLQFAFTDSNIVNCVTPADLFNVFTIVRVESHPKTVDTGGTTILWSQSNVVEFTDGETKVFWGTYYDVNNVAIFAGGTNFTDINDGDTDFTANSQSDGLGDDETSNFTITAEPFASVVKFTITNGAGHTVYVTKLQIRGDAIRDLAPEVYEAENGGIAKARTLHVDNPYQSNPNIIQALADYILNQFEDVSNQVDELVLHTTRDEDHLNVALTLVLGDRVSVTESVSGLDAAQAVIHRFSFRESSSGFLHCTVELAPNVVGDPSWLLEDATYGLLETSTILGPA